MRQACEKLESPAPGALLARESAPGDAGGLRNERMLYSVIEPKGNRNLCARHAKSWNLQLQARFWPAKVRQGMLAAFETKGRCVVALPTHRAKRPQKPLCQAYEKLESPAPGALLARESVPGDAGIGFRAQSFFSRFFSVFQGFSMFFRVFQAGGLRDEGVLYGVVEPKGNRNLCARPGPANPALLFDLTLTIYVASDVIHYIGSDVMPYILLHILS